MMASEKPPGPPPAHLRSHWVDSGRECHLWHHPRSLGSIPYLLLWLMGLTVACVFFTRLAIFDPKLFRVAATLPFWALWVWFVFLLLQALFMLEELVLNVTHARWRRRVLFFSCSREVPIGEVKHFCLSHGALLGSKNKPPQACLRMVTLGEGLVFGIGLPGGELWWLMHRLNERLAELKHGPSVAAVSAADGQDTPGADIASRQPRHFAGADTSAQPPSDSRWRLDLGFESLGFVQRGRLNLAVVGWLLSANVFWNGIVWLYSAVLLGAGPNPPQGAGWWVLFLFLIPMRVMGLLILLPLLYALLEPARETTWEFTRDSIRFSRRWLKIGWSRRYVVDRVDGIEVTGDGGGPGARNHRWPRLAWFLPWAGAWRVVVIDRDNVEVCSMKGLTEGDALWMRHQLRRNWPVGL